MIDLLSNQDFRNELLKDNFYINGQRLCFITWCMVYDLNYKYVYNVQKKMKENQEHVIAPAYIPEAPLRENVENFLREYMDLMAQWSPCGEKALIPEMNKKNFYYQEYVPQMMRENRQWCTYKYFNSIWNSEFKHIRMTSKQRFSVCQECQDFNYKIHQVLFYIRIFVLNNDLHKYVFNI